MGARRTQQHATLYDFRDFDLMMKMAEEVNGSAGIATKDLADLLGFAEDDNRPVGIRLGWMRRYGMVVFDDRERLWNLSPSGRRVIDAQLRSREIAVIDKMPDEAMVEVMAHVTSRYHHGKGMLAHLLRREFLYGTAKR